MILFKLLFKNKKLKVAFPQQYQWFIYYYNLTTGHVIIVL